MRRAPPAAPGGYNPFGKPTVYGGQSNLGLVPESYLKETSDIPLSELEGVVSKH